MKIEIDEHFCKSCGSWIPYHHEYATGSIKCPGCGQKWEFEILYRIKYRKLNKGRK